MDLLRKASFGVGARTPVKKPSTKGRDEDVVKPVEKTASKPMVDSAPLPSVQTTKADLEDRVINAEKPIEIPSKKKGMVKEDDPGVKSLDQNVSPMTPPNDAESPTSEEAVQPSTMTMTTTEEPENPENPENPEEPEKPEESEEPEEPEESEEPEEPEESEELEEPEEPKKPEEPEEPEVADVDVSATPGDLTEASADNVPVEFRWDFTDAGQVFLAGSFNNWSPSSHKLSCTSGAHMLSVELPAGKHAYKYVVDGQWFYDMTRSTECDMDGNVNNTLVV